MIEENIVPNLSKRAHYSPMILLIDGLKGTGKVIIQDLLLSLKKCSRYHSSMILEQIVVSELLKKNRESNKNANANAFMKQIIDNLAYNHCIGRDSNTKLSDLSSIFRSPHVMKEILKLGTTKQTEGEIKDLINERYIIQLFIHSTSFFSTLYEDTFEKLTPIYVVRDPSQGIPGYARYLPRITYDPREFTPKISNEGKDIPWYFHEDPDLFFKLSALEASAFIHAYAYRSLYQKLLSGNEVINRKNLLYDFQDLTEKPYESIENIACALNLQYNWITLKMQAYKNKVPRKPILRKEEDTVKNFSKTGILYFEESKYWYDKITTEFRSLREV